MDRRTFIQLIAATPIPSIASAQTLPKYRVVTAYSPASLPGMPGPFPGQVVSVKSAKCLDEASNKVEAEAVRQMMAQGICALTGEKQAIDAWRRFFQPSDIV